MLCPAADNLARCKIHAVVCFCFLRAKNMSAVEIHCELCTVYSQNLMSEGIVRQWYRMFMMKSEVVDWTSIMSNDLVQSVEQKFVKDGTSQFQNFRVNFHKFHALISTRYHS
jgi:hypothetical protein